MTTTDITALVAVIISIINLIWTIKLEKNKSIYQKKLENKDTLQELKQNIKDYRKTLNNIFKNKTKIYLMEKDIYSLNVDSSYPILEHCLKEETFKKYKDLEISIDETLDMIIYKEEYSLVEKTMDLIKDFLDRLNNISI